jgi:hypothetical protein
MRFASLFWGSLATLLVGIYAQAVDDDVDGGADQCTCSGLDYADGGSYLVDGNSDDDFTFTSAFEGISVPFSSHLTLHLPPN